MVQRNKIHQALNTQIILVSRINSIISYHMMNLMNLDLNQKLKTCCLAYGLTNGSENIYSLEVINYSSVSKRWRYLPRLQSHKYPSNPHIVGDEHVTIKCFVGNGRVELLQEQLKDRTTRTAELKLVIVGPPSSVPTTPPHPIT